MTEDQKKYSQRLKKKNAHTTIVGKERKMEIKIKFHLTNIINIINNLLIPCYVSSDTVLDAELNKPWSCPQELSLYKEKYPSSQEWQLGDRCDHMSRYRIHRRRKGFFRKVISELHSGLWPVF